MPNIENLEKKPFTKSSERLISARRDDILYRDDLKTGFGYAVTGILVTLAVAGLVYVVGKQMIK